MKVKNYKRAVDPETGDKTASGEVNGVLISVKMDERGLLVSVEIGGEKMKSKPYASRIAEELFELGPRLERAANIKHDVDLLKLLGDAEHVENLFTEIEE